MLTIDAQYARIHPRKSRGDTSRSRKYPHIGMLAGMGKRPATALELHVHTLMSARGIPSLTELARLAGLNPTYVRQWLSGKSQNPQASKLQQVADVLGVSLGDLMTPPLAGEAEQAKVLGELLDQVRSGGPPRATLASGQPLPVRFAVQAGAWLERDDLVQVPKRGPPVSADPYYPADAQWLELVRGDSMDLFYPEGAWVHVVDAITIGYKPRSEDFVTIERKRQQGGIIERSLKQIEIRRGGKVELWPRSRNPRWNGPLPLGEPLDVDDEVRIAALVIGGYLPARR
ncbi:MAG TPA: helix-turn-helix domain-containing protein [Terricaulis sp.]|nr:helix-turn-helix domain-containing protein [Terricaulis sp.]